MDNYRRIDWEELHCACNRPAKSIVFKQHSEDHLHVMCDSCRDAILHLGGIVVLATKPLSDEEFSAKVCSLLTESEEVHFRGIEAARRLVQSRAVAAQEGDDRRRQ